MLAPGSELRPNFWRAPTDNDLGWGSPEKLRVWRHASPPSLRGVTLLSSGVVRRTEQTVCVLSTWRLERPARLSPAEQAEKAREGGRCGVGANQSCVSCMHTVRASEPSVRVTCRYLPGASVRPGKPLPRFGLTLALARRFSRLSWFGAGPHETYADRRSAARLGVFEGEVSAQVHPYLRPQESGNKVGVRWLALREEGGGEDGQAVVFSSPRGHPALSASASHFAVSDLDVPERGGAGLGAAALIMTHHLTRPREVQRHAAELTSRNFTTVCLDRAQMGLGGVNSWGAKPRPMHLLPREDPIEVTVEIHLAGKRELPRLVHKLGAERGRPAAAAGGRADRCRFPREQSLQKYARRANTSTEARGGGYDVPERGGGGGRSGARGGGRGGGRHRRIGGRGRRRARP